MFHAFDGCADARNTRGGSSSIFDVGDFRGKRCHLGLAALVARGLAYTKFRPAEQPVLWSPGSRYVHHAPRSSGSSARRGFFEHPRKRKRPGNRPAAVRLDQINANTTRTKFVRLRQNPIFAIHFASMVTGKPSPYPAATVFSSWPRIAQRTSCGQPAARNRSCAR